MHMVWPGFDYSPANNYRPQTATSNFFPSGIKADENAKDFQQRQFAIAQTYAAAQYLNNFQTPARSASSFSSVHPHGIKKKEPKRVPDKEKTEEYRARRMKNNESAKRSREARRQKESEKDQKIAELQAHINCLFQENNRLKIEIQQYQFQLQAAHHMANATTTNNCNINSIPSRITPQPFYS